jgi:hypothetical protein
MQRAGALWSAEVVVGAEEEDLEDAEVAVLVQQQPGGLTLWLWTNGDARVTAAEAEAACSAAAAAAGMSRPGASIVRQSAGSEDDEFWDALDTAF